MSANEQSERKALLLQELRSQYKLQKVSLPLGEETFALHLVEDVDSLLDDLLAKGERHEDVLDERIPYWAELWPSAIAMADFILESKDIDSQTSVLEIGCGLGLSGVVAGSKGAEVTLSDYLPDALRMAELTWLENIARPAKLMQLDWREIDPALTYDWILAADVAYEERNFAPLISAFKILLKPGTRLLLTEPGRAIAQTFLSSLEKQGFSVLRSSRKVKWKGVESTIGLYLLSQTSPPMDGESVANAH